jgi:hypothetical protein
MVELGRVRRELGAQAARNPGKRWDWAHAGGARDRDCPTRTERDDRERGVPIVQWFAEAVNSRELVRS